ncbi:MAG: TRAP transporter large permease [Thermotogota bacterium]|nr:TRAP transporter large permease [Thermotogota bacterium]
MGLALFFIVFLGAFALGFPIAFAMVMGGFTYFITAGVGLGSFMDVMAIELSGKDVLMAVPMFIFAANLMNDTDVTDIIFGFVKQSMGGVRGGLAYTNIATSIIFAGMSGSEIADVSGIGAIEIKAMMDDGYDGEFASAVTCASATISPIIPPSIPMVIYAMLTGASLGYLFLAGIIPGLLIALLEAGMVYYLSKKRGYPKGKKYPFKVLLKSFRRSFAALLAPIMLLVGIYGGIFTPTEAAAVLVGYVLLISIIVYKKMSFKKFKKIIMKTVYSVGFISFMIAAALIVKYVLAREEIPLLITNFFIDSGMLDSRFLLLLSTNIMFFLLGMFFDVSVIQLVVIPIMLPLVEAVGIDLVHFGVITTVNLMLALDTPPYGQTGYITSALSKTPVSKVFGEMLRYFIPIEILGLILITYFPDIVLWLPRIFGYAG